jgi:hypothetical protein
LRNVVDRLSDIDGWSRSMSFLHYGRQFLELGTCKEHSMPRKTTESTTIKRSKKTEMPVTPSVTPTIAAAPEIQNEVRKPVRKNGKTASVPVPVNVEEEIRRRAYELYLERRATAGSGSGDENQDWLVAEREILTRLGGEQPRA